ncbi:MAG: heavy metal translocating P-type ATPase [Candidatus Polarisedimenticolaceae bacterium]|nr:heavy metal translocating P-type ATPase [Candidatus Polarisedimenticolaceae bacterium]
MQSDSSESAGCFHCTLPLPNDDEITATIDGDSQHFCCTGCKAVCEAIYDAGLEGFYQRTPDGQSLAPPPDLPKELLLYDLDEVQEEFVSSLDDQRSISLLVEGIHCAACVWLIEHTLRKLAGVEEIKVNLSARRLHLKWDNSQLPLSMVIKRLGQIGYAAVPFDPEVAEGAIKRENRMLLYRMAFAAFTMMNLLWVSIALYSGADQSEYRGLFHLVGFILATPTLLFSGYPFYKGAWIGLRNLRPSMDLPIAIGATITYLYSIYITFSSSAIGEVYYDTVVNFLFVILVGRYLEAISKRQAVASTQRLLDLQPRVARVLRDGEEVFVPIRAVKVAEIVLLKPGERIPVDGVISWGQSSIDEALLTGESVAVNKTEGDKVSAGTINGNGVLKIEVTAVLKKTALGRIIDLVEEAQASKAPIQGMADRIVPWFVVATLGLATATFFWWWQTDFELALMAATSVLIITCPCAFGLATPMAIAVASGQGARHGILIKNGEVLERLSDINHFVFDKTGTLTEGKMSVTTIVTAESRWDAGSEQDLSAQSKALLRKLYALESLSEHPIAQAIVNAGKLRGFTKAAEIEGFVSKPGAGLSGLLNGEMLVIGTRSWLVENGIAAQTTLDQVADELESQGTGLIYCAINGEEVALIGVEDRIRPEAAAMVAALKRDGLELTMLSGDRQRTAEIIAERLGGLEVIAEVLPEEKDQVIQQLQQDKQHKVAMVGDGVNDAPALVRADVGIAMGSGTDVSIASADIVLMSAELNKVRQASALSRRTLRTIRQNIAISITYNIIMVPMAMMTFVSPLVAAISMPISSLLVIGNAARIRTLFKGEKEQG